MGSAGVNAVSEHIDEIDPRSTFAWERTVHPLATVTVCVRELGPTLLEATWLYPGHFWCDQHFKDVLGAFRYNLFFCVICDSFSWHFN